MPVHYVIVMKILTTNMLINSSLSSTSVCCCIRFSLKWQTLTSTVLLNDHSNTIAIFQYWLYFWYKWSFKNSLKDWQSSNMHASAIYNICVTKQVNSIKPLDKTQNHLIWLSPIQCTEQEWKGISVSTILHSCFRGTV